MPSVRPFNTKKKIKDLLCIYIVVSLVPAFIAAIDAAAPQSHNLCDRIRCDDNDTVKVCGTNAGVYKVFENSCELRKFNCNRGQSKRLNFYFIFSLVVSFVLKFNFNFLIGFAPVDTEACRVVFELGMGFLFDMK